MLPWVGKCYVDGHLLASLTEIGVRRGGDRCGEAPRLSLVDLNCRFQWEIATQVCKDEGLPYSNAGMVRLV